jgi:hypothetical protein
MKKKLTGQDGASKERQAWMAKLRRLLRACSVTDDHQLTVCGPLHELLVWGSSRTLRFNKRAGGLGK